MQATIEGVRRAAFARWEHRGHVHGFDPADWLAAEQQERFAQNYRVVAADRLDADAPRAIGSPTRRRCRFCDHGIPRATFAQNVPVFPASFGPGVPIAFDQCEGCVAEFTGGIDLALARFVDLGVGEADRVGIPVDVFKGLTRLALAVMPASDLDDHEETNDWIANQDHAFDFNVFRGLACVLHLSPTVFPASWSALARRECDDEAWPSMLYFLGLGRLIYEIAIPLAQRDDDLDVPLAARPDVQPPCPFGLGFDPIARRILPISACGHEQAIPEVAASRNAISV